MQAGIFLDAQSMLIGEPKSCWQLINLALSLVQRQLRW